MHLTLSAIGKLKKGPEQELVQRYQKRLHWRLEVFDYPEASSNLTVEDRNRKEADLLLAKHKPSAILIALDENGKTPNSPEFATRLAKFAEDQSPEFHFVIGGPDGLCPSLLEKCNYVLSFGRLTWPHQLVRGLLIEQLYRAQTILDGHPYHRQ
jgi:23S rRNA (pseudouridine1915-N3)-methyltransferase